MKLRKWTIGLTTLAMASSLSVTSAFADSYHGNQNNWDANRYQQSQNYGTEYNRYNQNQYSPSQQSYHSAFNDLGNYGWAQNAISRLVSQGIFKGVGKNQFNPGGKLTRAQMSVLLSQYFGLESTNQSQNQKQKRKKYADVRQGDWYYNQVEATQDYFTSNGNSFNPNHSMSRAETAATLVNLLVQKGTLQLVSSDQADQILGQYADADQIPSNERVYVATAIQAGIMNGVGQNTFDPQGTLTRAEIATLLYNLQQGQLGLQPVEVPPTSTTGTENVNTPVSVVNVSGGEVTLGQNVYVQTNQPATVYFVANNGTSLINKAQLDSLVSTGQGTVLNVIQVNSNVAIPTSSLSAGNYVIYAVDAYGNLSEANTGIQLAASTANVNEINSVSVSNQSTDENGNVLLNVAVATEGVVDNTPVEVELVNADGSSLNPSISQAGTISNNQATVTVTIPTGLQQGTYHLKTTVGSAVNEAATYTQP
jgi:hypothetical protein